MLNGKKILALIPARGGSKGIKEKNIIDLCGQPLISYTIKAALASRYIDSVIVSTDSEKIRDVAQKFGADVPFLRPEHLATDHSKTANAVIHAIEYLRRRGREYDTLILLQPTSPLRTAGDMDRALETYCEHNFEGLVSVSSVNDSPILMRSIGEDGRLVNLLKISSSVRRQDMQEFFHVNGGIYINEIAGINSSISFNDNRIPFFMPVEHSIDIDDNIDLYIAEYYLKKESRGPIR